MTDLLDKAGKMASDAAGAVGGAAKSVGDTASDLAGKAVDATADTAGNLGKAVAGAASDTAEAATDVVTGENKTEEPPRT
jgi:hypothetical protein